MTTSYIREVSIWVTNEGIKLGVYGANGARISGTVFVAWPAVLDLLARMTDEGYDYRVFVREDL